MLRGLVVGPQSGSEFETRRARRGSKTHSGKLPPTETGWTEENEAWLKLWSKQVKMNQLAYDQASFWFRKLYIWLKLCAIFSMGFTTFAPIAAISRTGECAIGDISVCYGLQWAAVTIGAIGFICASIIGAIEPNSIALKHQVTAKDMEYVGRRLDIVLQLEREHRPEPYSFCVEISDHHQAVLNWADWLPKRFAYTTELPNKTVMENLTRTSTELHHADTEAQNDLQTHINYQLERLAQSAGRS